MAAFVDSTVREIDDRLRELRDEESKLEAARAALAGNGGVRRTGPRPARRRSQATSARASATATTTRRRTGGRRGRRSAPRGAQAVEIVSKQPGITTAELAKAMKIQPNYLYRLLPKLAGDGQLKRDGKGWRPAT